VIFSGGSSHEARKAVHDLIAKISFEFLPAAPRGNWRREQKATGGGGS
jgi:hypothetical protein